MGWALAAPILESIAHALACGIWDATTSLVILAHLLETRLGGVKFPNLGGGDNFEFVGAHGIDTFYIKNMLETPQSGVVTSLHVQMATHKASSDPFWHARTKQGGAAS